jgi:hypothetical protein
VLYITITPCHWQGLFLNFFFYPGSSGSERMEILDVVGQARRLPIFCGGGRSLP